MHQKVQQNGIRPLEMGFYQLSKINAHNSAAGNNTI
jgi:hypothetical protein